MFLVEEMQAGGQEQDFGGGGPLLPQQPQTIAQGWHLPAQPLSGPSLPQAHPCSVSPEVHTLPQPKREHIWHPTLPLAVSSKTTSVNIFPTEHVVIPTPPSPSQSRENNQMCTGFSAAPGNLRQGPVSTPGQKQTRARSQREVPHRRWDGRVRKL